MPKTSNRMSKYLYSAISLLRIADLDKEEKIFCLSMQRTGTTSVGKFFRDFGYRWAGWPSDKKNDWTGAWYRGDFESIFRSTDFRLANAFEDSPWFCPGFYKILYHRYPDAKFILFTREPDAWFQSMLKHSGNNVIGRSVIHCKIYRREPEYFKLLDEGIIQDRTDNQIDTEKVMKLSGMEEHYKSIYLLHNREVIDFFSRHAPQALHIGQLEDNDKWKKLGKFLSINVPDNYACHENSSANSNV